MELAGATAIAGSVPVLQARHAIGSPSVRSSSFISSPGRLDLLVKSRSSLSESGCQPGPLVSRCCCKSRHCGWICQGTTLRCPGGSQSLGNKLQQIARQCKNEAFGSLPQRPKGIMWVFPGDEHFPTTPC